MLGGHLASETWQKIWRDEYPCIFEHFQWWIWRSVAMEGLFYYVKVLLVRFSYNCKGINLVM